MSSYQNPKDKSVLGANFENLGDYLSLSNLRKINFPDFYSL